MSTVLFVDSNSAGHAALGIEAARSRGFRTHFLCRNPTEYRRRPLDPTRVADEVSVVDTFDVTKMLRVVAGRRDYVAVLAYDELRVVQAALLGDHLNLKYNPPASAMIRVRFKDLLRGALADTPWAVRHALVPLDTTTSPLGYPCVTKLVDEAATVGVRQCRDDGDFQAALDRLRVIVDQPNKRGYQSLPVVLVEEYLAGLELSAELVWSRELADWSLIGFTTKEHASQFGVETGHVFPYSLDAPEGQCVLEQLRQCLRPLGLCHTVLHAEFRLQDGKVSLIEVNPRPAGGRINDLVYHTFGVSLVEMHLAAHLGVADDLLVLSTPRSVTGVRFLLPDRPGTIRGFDVDDDEDDSLIDLRITPTPIVVGDDISNELYLGSVVVAGPTLDAVTQGLDRHLSRIHPRYA